MNNSILTTALALADRGYSVIPCQGKRAAVPWQLYTRQRASKAEILGWHKDGSLSNLAIVLGKVSGVFCIDLDGDKAVAAWDRFWGQAHTVIVASGSGHGQHVYFRPESPELMPETTRALTPEMNVELRSNGTYVIVPPSIHPDTRAPYRIISDYGVAELAAEQIEEIVRWIRGHRPSPVAPAVPSAGPRNPTRVARAALIGECAKVRGAAPGNRNHTLFIAALKLGKYVALGQLAQSDVEAELTSAAHGLIEDDGLMTVRRTITSGLSRGVHPW